MINDLNIIEKRQEILRVVAFYDIFDYPLTILEIKNQLNIDSSLIEIEDILTKEIINSKISLVNGLYFLKGRDNIISIRRQRYNYSLKKIKIARFFAKIFSQLPFVLAIYTCRSSSVYNFKKESDIDFFIITKDKRIWLSRLFLAGLTKLLNKRPNKKTKKDKICLSFYVSENNLDLSALKVKDGDPDFEFWEKNLLLLYNKNNIHQKFLNINNLNKQFKNNKIVLNERTNKFGLFSKILGSLEKMSFKFQLKIMPRYLQLAVSDQGNVKGVIFNENIIKLHLRDPRLKIKELYEEKIKRLS